MDTHHEELKEIDKLATMHPGQHKTFASILQSYLSRRTLLKGTLANLVLAYANPRLGSAAEAKGAGFIPLQHSSADKLLVPEGYEYNIVMRWGDPVAADAGAFDPAAQQPVTQAGQFGYNADFVGFLSLPYNSRNSDRGLLVVNHEYTN